MSELMKANVEEATYFITFATVGWVDVFTRKAYVDILFESLEFCRANKGLEIFDYAIMPSHVHLIARRRHGPLSDVLRDFKSFTAKKIMDTIATHPQESRREWIVDLFSEYAKRSAQNSDQMFWQKTNHPELIHSAEFYEQKSTYIRNNPVAMGLVTEPEHYALSSAHQQTRLKCDEA